MKSDQGPHSIHIYLTLHNEPKEEECYQYCVIRIRQPIQIDRWIPNYNHPF